ncbi:MAG TPA: carboxypeptidase regulatory-like domain-containing protein, partial [Pyrinomonadaceae bacterium]|nr:carboxypeptidase regulatory-like domain-containing protein [Pyrinomonadaceae bacterium]
MFGIVLRRVLALAVFVLAFSFISAAQTLDQVSFYGKVTDANGAIVAGASVTASQTQTHNVRTAVTDSDGRYRLTFFESGPYDLSISMQGFADKKIAGINTTLGQAVENNLQIAPAGVTAESTITVGGDESPIVDTTKTVAGGTITEREIEELPNQTRNSLDLIFTLGGVAEEPLSSRDVAEDRAVTGVNAAQAPLEAGIFSLSGGAAYSNNITVDGFDNNDDRLAQDRYRPSLETVREVQVVTNQFSAEYGRASGGRANIITRGGSDRYHGRIYGFLSDAKFNANTYNNNLRGLQKLPFREWQPGGTLGGPLRFGYFKHKTYWFVGYDFDQVHSLSQIDTVVPVNSPSFFTLPSPTGGPTRQECTSSPSPLVCNPQPAGASNVTAGLTPAIVAPYITGVLTPARTHTGLARIDHNFSSTNNLTVRYQLGRVRNVRQYRVPTNTLEDAFQGTTRDTDAINLTHNLVIGSRFTNQFRYQYSKFVPEFGATNDTSPVLLITLNDRAAPTTAAQRNGTLVAGNSTAAANGNFSNNRQERRNQFSEEFTYLTGQMALRFGGDVQVIKSDYFALADATGTYNFNSVADFLANRIIRFRRNFGTNSASSNTYSGFFFQDDWRAKPNLSINFGVRKEFESILRDHNNWGPRIGIAFDPRGKSKSVIRFGAGIFYNRALLRTIDDFTLEAQQLNFDSRLITGPALDASCFTATNPQPTDARCQFLRTLAAGRAAPTLQELQSSTIPGVSTAFTNTTANFARRLDPTLKIPESYQALIGYERQISKQFAIEATFTWNRTIKLWREFNA